MEFTVCLAGINVAIKSLFDEVYDFCRDYLTDAPADMSVTVNAEDIFYEKNVNTSCIQEDSNEDARFRYFPDAWCCYCCW